MERNRIVRHFICICMIMIVLLSGMCIQKQETDSALSYANFQIRRLHEKSPRSMAGNPTSSTIVSPVKTAPEEYYTEEGAPVRLMNMMRIGSAVRQGVRYSIRLIAAALLAVLTAVYISYCSKARRMERSYCTDRRSVIIQYIQHQDGSKG